MTQTGQTRLVLVTGLSGAGKSIALKTLEDAGFEAIDNLPLAFLSAVSTAQTSQKPLAIGVDIRSRDFTPEHFLSVIGPIKKNPALKCTIVYLDCDDETLQLRFTETRRRHPLAADRAVMDGIHQERALLEPLKKHADLIIDTSELKTPDFRHMFTQQIAPGVKKLAITLTSFSFKAGLPREADMVLDVRFLKNPHYEPALKEQTGKDKAVGEYIAADAALAPFVKNTQALLEPLLPRYLEEGKSYLTLAIGCTGGRHRSVYVTELLGKWLQDKGYDISVRHRDL